MEKKGVLLKLALPKAMSYQPRQHNGIFMQVVDKKTIFTRRKLHVHQETEVAVKAMPLQISFLHRGFLVYPFSCAKISKRRRRNSVRVYGLIKTLVIVV